MENAFLQRAQQSTRILIDGTEVDPKEIGIDLTPYEGTTHEIEIHISKEVLAHELSEVGESVDISSLEKYVKRDIESTPFDAIFGYLGIAQSILNKPEKSKTLGLFFKRRANNCVRWTIVRIALVKMDNESLILRGSVRAVSC